MQARRKRLPATRITLRQADRTIPNMRLRSWMNSTHHRERGVTVTLTDVSEWICSQLTFTHDPLVKLVDALYLIFKFAVALWQSFDDDICSARQVLCSRAYKKQVLADLEFVLGHNALHRCTRKSSAAIMSFLRK